jgi:predicted kinase
VGQGGNDGELLASGECLSHDDDKKGTILKILLMRGLPASGKSTFARNLVANSSTWRRINRDDLRAMIDNGQFSESKETHIRRAELALASVFLDAGLNVIVDDCNLSPSAMAMWQNYAHERTVPIEIKDFTDVPLEVCLERDRHRPNYVGEEAIRTMYKKYLAPQRPASVPSIDLTLPHAKIFDLDGTLFLIGDRNPYAAELCERDAVNTPVLEALLDAWEKKEIVLLVSGRRETHRPHTDRALNTHQIPYNALFMRAEGDTRKDAIIKREIYEQEIKGKYAVTCVYDDRNQTVKMWREELGLTVFQVADGDY